MKSALVTPAHEHRTTNVGRWILVGVTAVAWTVYDLIVFVFSAIAVMDSDGELFHSQWGVAGAALLVPLAILAQVAFMRVRRGRLIPDTLSGRVLFGTQVVGLCALTLAVSLPTLMWRAYFNPSAEILVENRVPYTSSITIDAQHSAGHGQDCTGGDFLEQHTEERVKVFFDDAFGGCWGVEPYRLQVFNALGTWTCAWDDANARKPIVITEDGPGCAHTSYEPGILRQPAKPGATPFSPPYD